ncbi:MAG: DUF4418 family protein [Anaerolineae bacterium]|nr:DUF4418 family protein [Anaerolineae bacterium]
MKIVASLIIVLALLIAIVPQFTDCESQGKMLTLESGKQVSMKCHWTARAEIAVGVPLLVVGLLIPFSKRKESIRNLGIVGAVLGVMTILLPGILIGVCSNDDMICNSLMDPVLVLAGVLVIAASLAAIWLSRGREQTNL